MKSFDPYEALCNSWPINGLWRNWPIMNSVSLYTPLMTHYTIGPFPAHVIFRPSQGPFILGLISSIRLLTARYRHFFLWAKFSPWLQSACLWPVNPLGCFHSLIKYVLLTAHYCRAIKQTISTLARLRPIIGPGIVQPMFGETIIWPVEGP